MTYRPNVFGGTWNLAQLLCCMAGVHSHMHPYMSSSFKCIGFYWVYFLCCMCTFMWFLWV